MSKHLDYQLPFWIWVLLRTPAPQWLKHRVLLFDTIRVFTNNPPSVNENRSCVYLGADGQMCSAGRVFEDTDWREGTGVYENEEGISHHLKRTNISIEFLGRLQCVHDLGIKYVEGPEGAQRVKAILDVYCCPKNWELPFRSKYELEA